MKRLELKMEAPAIRVKKQNGDDSVVGSLNNGVCIIQYVQTQDMANNLLEVFEQQALLYKKLLPTIVLDKNLTFDTTSDKCQIVFDYSGKFFDTYQTLLYAIDEDGIIIYIGDDVNECLNKIMQLLEAITKKHSHEDWMRAY